MGDELFTAQAADKVGPQQDAGRVLAVTTASQSIDLFSPSGPLYKHRSKIVRIISDVNLFYVWGAPDTSVNPAAVNDDPGRCDLLPAGMPEEHVPTNTHFVFRGASAGTVRIFISSTKSRVR